jgi:general secretion pathway protein J
VIELNESGRIGPPPDREAGMTLVELLVTLTLLGIMSVALMGSLQFGARAWEASERGSDAQDEVLLAHGFLWRELEQAAAKPNFGEVDEDGKGSFTGDGRSLQFIAPWLGALGQGGLYRFGVELRDSDVVVMWQPLELEQDRAEIEGLSGERVILEDVETITFQYFGVGEDDIDPAWHAEWREEELVPRLVKLEVLFETGSQKNWPLFVVSIRTM